MDFCKEPGSLLSWLLILRKDVNPSSLQRTRGCHKFTIHIQFCEIYFEAFFSRLELNLKAFTMVCIVWQASRRPWAYLQSIPLGQCGEPIERLFADVMKAWLMFDPLIYPNSSSLYKFFRMIKSLSCQLWSWSTSESMSILYSPPYSSLLL